MFIFLERHVSFTYTNDNDEVTRFSVATMPISWEHRVTFYADTQDGEKIMFHLTLTNFLFLLSLFTTH